MIYEVRARLFFDEEDEALDFRHDCELALGKAVIVNPDTEAVEYSLVEEIENHHAEDPNAPCRLIASASNQPD